MKNVSNRLSAVLASALALGLAAEGAAQTQQSAATPQVGHRITHVVTLNAKPGRGADLEAAVRNYFITARARGSTMTYELGRTSVPGTYKLIEYYRDEAALAAHRATTRRTGLRQAADAIFGALLETPEQNEC